MSLAIEMTIRGVLLAGKWATEDQLKPGGERHPKILDGWRNHLISALVDNTDPAYYQKEFHTKSELYFQGCGNDTLIGMGAVVVFLREAGIRDEKALKTMWHGDHRNALIMENNIHTGRPVPEFQAITSNQRLVQIGLQWFPTSTPKNPLGDGSVADPTFGDPDNKAIDPTVFGYFEMIFERARTHYLASNTQQAQLLLAWINNVFPIIPLDSANKEKITPFTNSALALKKNLGQKLDCYGYTPDHVPVGSLEYYKAQSEHVLKSFKDIEKNYYDYRSESRKDQERHADYVKALGQTKALCDALATERDNTQLMIKGTVSDIKAVETEVEAARGTLIEKTRDLSAQIQQCFSVPNIDQLAGIMLNLSFMPEKQFAQRAMIGSQALTAGSDIIHALAKVKMDDGTEIDQSLVINRLDTMGGDIANLSAGYTVSQKFIGKDAGVYRILQKAEEFDALCRKFYESAPAARQAQTSMDDYVRKINYRNAKIDEYNALWVRLGDLQGQLSKLNADKDKTAIELARSEQPGLPRRVAAFDNLYNRVRDTSLKYLYSMGRAYSFWALKPYDELTTVCKLFDPDSIDHATLWTAMSQIEEHCAAEIEGCRSSLRQAALPDAGADLKEATGITVTLTKESHPGFIESLKTKGVAEFELLATHPSFGGKANVRLTRVRAWIYGMKTGINTPHDVIITHCGPETIITTDKKPIKFMHDRVTVMFRYDVSKGLENPRAIFEGHGGTHDGIILENNYAPIGPFTTWRLAILEDNNKELVARFSQIDG